MRQPTSIPHATPRSFRARLVLAFATALLASISLPLAGCSLKGRQYRIPDPDLLPLPSHDAPYEPVRWQGRTYCLYDVDGDLRPDWIWDDTHREYRPIAVPSDGSGFPDWTIEDIIDIIGAADGDPRGKVLEAAMATAPDEPRPPLDMTARDAYVAFVAPDGALAYELTVDAEGGTADFWLALEAGGGVADPRDHPRLRYQFGQVRPKDPADPAFNWIRVVGPAADAFAYAVELGVDVNAVLADLARSGRLDP